MISLPAATNPRQDGLILHISISLWLFTAGAIEHAISTHGQKLADGFPDALRVGAIY